MVAIHLFCLVLGLALSVTAGEDITIRLPHVTKDVNGNCRFPEVFNIALIRHLTPAEILNIRLEHNGATTSSNYVYFMKRVDVKGIYLQRVDLQNADFQSVQGYHNNNMGTAFTVKCSPNTINSQFYQLEGSIFLDGKKHIIEPSAFLYNTANVSQDGVSFSYHMKEVFEHSAADAAAKFVPQGVASHSSKVNSGFQSAQHGRTRRQQKVYYIDILVVIDVSMYQRWLPLGNYNRTTTASLITNYLTNIFSSVNMRLDTLDLKGTKLKALLLPLQISESEDTSPWNAKLLQMTTDSTTIEASALLAAFKNYVTSSQLPFDHAMLLTSYDIYGGNDQGIRFNLTKGLAYVRTICSRSNGESSSVIEEKGAYQSEGVIAHELGHSLGSKHDGDNNNCPSSSRFLMSDSSYNYSNETKLNPWKFSTCSSQAILSKLQELEKTEALADCLNSQSGLDVNTIEDKLADDQCKMFYGNTSFVCRGSSLPHFSEVCTEFSCRVPGMDYCTTMIAATGTCCGKNKHCIQGSCEQSTTSQCSNINEVCPLGDQPGVVKYNMTCSQLSSTECYLEDIQIRCCDTCMKVKTKFNNSAACPYGDKRYNCTTSLCGSTTLDNLDYNFYCCGTCPPGTITPICFNTSASECGTCEQALNEKSNALCYNKLFHANYCTNACEARRNKESKDCPWGDRNICSSSYANVPPGFVCNSTQRYNCCGTCDRIPTTTSTTTTTTSTTRSTLSSRTTTKTTKKTPDVTPTATGQTFGGNTASALMSFQFRAIIIGLVLVLMHR